MENNLVFEGENHLALTNSLLVAETFKKEHSKVMRSIENILGQAKIGESSPMLSKMFEKTTYLNEQNKEQPMYIMNRDGFTMLVMGFTGKKAFDFKLQFIEAFDKMEDKLKGISEDLSSTDMIVRQAQMFMQIALKQQEQEKKQKEQDLRIQEVGVRASALEFRLDAMDAEREKNIKELKESNYLPSKIPEAEISERASIRQMVNDYASALNIPQQEVWHKVYADLYYKYGKSINSYNKTSHDSKLDVAERNGLLPYMTTILSSMVHGLH